MTITLDPSLRADPELSAAVEAKSGLLGKAIDLATARAEWRRATDARGRPLAELHLRDQFDGQATAGFAPDEFRNDTQLEYRFRDLKAALVRVAEWRRHVRALFATLRPWCEGLPGHPLVREEPWAAVEERSGEYETTRLEVRRAGQVLTITPVGAWVVAADGRVDMAGPGDRAVLLYDAPAGRWYHVPNYLPRREQPLDEPLFRQLAEDCFDD